MIQIMLIRIYGLIKNKIYIKKDLITQVLFFIFKIKNITMENKNAGMYEERESFGSRPSKGRKKEEWVEESFNVDPGPSTKKTNKKNPKKPTKKN